MEILAVIVGYVLGIAPFIVPKIIERLDSRKNVEITESDIKEQNEIYDEWLNGAKVNEPIQANQQEIYNEYVTGKVVKGE